MTPRQYAAGWRLVDDPDAGPELCIGSGQRLAFPVVRRAFSAPWDVCPECGRRVSVVDRDGVDVLANHQPPEPAARGSAARPDGPTLGL